MVKHKFLAVYGLLGSRTVERTLCFVSKHLGVEAVIMLGNTVSPLAVHRLSNDCGIRVLGVLGELDNPAVAQALKAVQGLVECRVVEVSGVKFFGLGLSSCREQETSIDILVTSRPGVRATCCEPGSDLVDTVYDVCKPRMVLVGGCKRPCITTGVVSPGVLGSGFFGVLNVGEQSYTFQIYQLDRYVLRLLSDKNATI